MTIYLNLFGGPGAGKSTMAAELFAALKKEGHSVELVTEYVKDLVWENRLETIAIQPYVSMKQFRNLYRLKGKVDYVVTDSPLLKDLVYANKYNTLPESYSRLIKDLNAELTSMNFYLTRQFDYQTDGRLQTEYEALEIDKEILKVLEDRAFWVVTSLDQILQILKDEKY